MLRFLEYSNIIQNTKCLTMSTEGWKLYMERPSMQCLLIIVKESVNTLMRNSKIPQYVKLVHIL